MPHMHWSVEFLSDTVFVLHYCNAELLVNKEDFMVMFRWLQRLVQFLLCLVKTSVPVLSVSKMCSLLIPLFSKQ